MDETGLHLSKIMARFPCLLFPVAVCVFYSNPCHGYYKDYSVGKMIVAWNYKAVCENGQQRHFADHTTNHIRVSSTVKLVSKPSSVFGSRPGERLRFSRSDWRRQVKYGYPTQLYFDIVKPAKQTMIRNFNVKVKGAREVKVDYSEDGTHWTWAATMVSDKYLHVTEGPLFEFEYLRDTDYCDWRRYNCNGVRAKHLRLTLTNPRHNRMVPEVYGVDIDACFVTKDGHPPLECLQDSRGYFYVGTTNHTRGNKPCKPWTDINYADGLKFYTYFPVEFPDGSAVRATNYCRTQGAGKSPGCHTSDDYRDWDECDIALCKP